MTLRRRDWREALAREGRLLESLSYRRVLDRGFAVVRDAAGAVAAPETIKSGEALILEFAGERRVAAIAAETATKPKRAAKPSRPPEQGSLL